MAAEPQRTNQSLVNGQNEDGSSSRGIADRDTVGGEQIQEHQKPEGQRARPPAHFNWPRQQRPQEFGRGFTPPPNRLPLQGGIRRASPWSVLKAKLPDQPHFRFSHEHQIQRMQNLEDRPRVQEPNGVMRPPSGMVRPPPGQMSRPQTQEGSLTPSPGGAPPPRSPFLQRADSRTGFQNVPGMPRPMSAGRPPSASQMGRSLDDDDDVMTGSAQSRPGSARPMSMPGPMGVRPGSGPPMRPPNRTPPQSPAGPGMYPMRSPQSGRQSSLSSLSEQGEQKTEGLPMSRPPSVNPNIPRPQSAALRPEPTAAQPPPPEPSPQPVKPNPDVERKLSVTINEPDNLPKRPTDLAGPPRGEKDVANTNGEVKEVANDQTKKEPVVNGNQESPKKSPSKAATPKKLGNVQTPVKSPSKISPKTPDTPGTAEKKNENTEKTSDPNNDTQNRVHFAQEQPKDTKKQEELKKTESEEQREQSKPSPKPTPANEKISTSKPESPKPATPTLKSATPISKPATPKLTPANEKVSTSKTSKPESPKPATPILKPATPKPTPVNEKVSTQTTSKLESPKSATPILKPATPISKPATPKPTIIKQDSLQNSLPETPLIKVPMNKVQVGAAPSPNLKCVKSKIGSLENAKHRPGGGNIKIENRKLNFSATPKIEAKNEQYTPGGGEKKIQNVKLQWNAKSKIGSLENASHKPGGGDKKIESVKLDFKEKAKPKVGSKDNIKHTPGGGIVKIEDQKLEIKATSKIGSLDNVKYKPGGGEIKIFDDKEYLKQMAGPSSDVHAVAHQGKKSRSSSSSSRQKLSDSRSGTSENLSENKQESPEKISKPIGKPIDQNSNQLQEKAQEKKTEVKKDTLSKPSQPLAQGNLESQKDANANGKVIDDKQKETSPGMAPVIPNEKKENKPAEKVIINQENKPNQTQIFPEKPAETVQQAQINSKNVPPLISQPQINSAINNGIKGPNSPLPNQSNGVTKPSVPNLPTDKNDYPSVVEKSLIEKTEKELQNPVELHKNKEGIK
ncbi:microtubule-associated protein 4-like isoform X2 [Cimex lectularius]|uniref:Microtubule-associated protein n=1 Tax=Cimex lectularius TaxID=79782 RepID=A0A8I6S8P3_CIMLE|nr:microtubule-associated protein 4-like isoform X2 [Cimex lectularius]